MIKIRLPLRDRSYDILVGASIVAKFATWKTAGFKAGRAFVFADARLRDHARALVHALRSAGWKPVIIKVEASEKLKDFRQVYPLYGKLLELGADRYSVIFALGGGTIGDAVGFVAGTYLRGVRWIGVPTTLLAQVDSSIGGKTGINHNLGKNLIGVFHQPSLVVCDTDFLRTLSSRDRLSGLAEMIKYGLIYDPSLWRLFQKQGREILNLEPRTLEKTVAACARWKARAVVRDEKDVSGAREVLNFGHTIGHALEALTRFGYFRHGEAILLGMRAASALSLVRGHLKPSIFEEIDRFFSSFAIPVVPASITGRRLLRQIRFDKKMRAGKIRWVLLKAIGRTVLDSNVKDAEVLKALEITGIQP